MQARVLVIGNFDGVHLGHQKLINLAKSRALESNLELALLTFEPHPKALFQEKDFYLVQDYKSKYEVLKSLVKDIFVLEFNQELSKLTPKQFIEKIIELYAVKEICVGSDFRFAYQGCGNITTLKELCQQFKLKLHVLELENFASNKISSSTLRAAIAKGNLNLFKELSKRTYSLYGELSSGFGIGKKLGYPTLNFLIDKVALSFGVYIVELFYFNKLIKGLANYGISPTFHQNIKPRLEIHLPNLEFNELNNQPGFYKIEFLKFLRAEKKFLSKEELKMQIQKDILAYESFIK